MHKEKSAILSHILPARMLDGKLKLAAPKRRKLRSGIDGSKPVRLGFGFSTLRLKGAAHTAALPESKHGWLSVAVAAVTAFGMAAAIAISPQNSPNAVATETVVQQLAPAAQPESLGDGAVFWREERILRTDTTAGLLGRLSVTDPAFAAFLQKDAQTSRLFKMQAGKAVTAKTTEKGEVVSFYYPLSGDNALTIDRTAAGFKSAERNLPLVMQQVMKSGEIQSSLFGALDAAGLPDTIASQLSEIFGSQIDFHNDLVRGDRFTVVFESFLHEGRPIRTGRILAAEFINDGQSHRAIFFGDRDGKGSYYSPEGKNLKQSLLRSPLEFSRVTSGFSSSRLHPVLGYSRAHAGVDYGAPIGTPVRATADGTIDFIGRQSGYGNIIVLKHRDKFTTYYAHLNEFARGLQKGSRISQGDEIGFVGRTGIATGPHLHYEVRIDDVPQNPMSVAAISNPQLAGSQLSSFKTRVASYSGQLDLLRNTSIGRIE